LPADFIAVRTASQLRKGKYVAESESEDDFRSPSIQDDPEDDDFEDNESEFISDAGAESPVIPDRCDEDEDIYGDQIPSEPAASSTRTPPSKRQKLSKTFVALHDSAKSSTSSSVFSPANSLDTPATSVSSSIRKVNSALRTAKRKLEEVIVIDDSEESEFEMDEDEDGREEDYEDSVSLAPTIISEESSVVQTIGPSYRRPNRTIQHGSRRAKWKPCLSQWQRTNIALCEYHPELVCIWDELEIAPLITPVKVPQPEGLSLQLLPFQLEGLDWLLKQEQQVRFSGGILADEMGMGKTIQTIALLLAEPRGKPNLVVAPTVALMQWKSEIETHTNNGLSVCLYYGTSRNITAKQLKEHDVILTTCTHSLFYF
jgi:DNA repair protein RAD16